MQHTQRLDQRLHVLREEVRTMTREKQQGERVWREKLQRCQRQLKAKEDEMSRQSQYFENFKVQLQHKLSVARDREQTLQNRVYTLEKQLLEMTVNAATGMATTRAVRITAGTVTHLEEQDRLPSTRGEGEGEEEKREERRLQWQSNVAIEREERQEEDEGKTENDVGGQNNDAKHPSNEARLQSFIISLQEDLKVLLEREEDRLTEQRGLMEQLQEAQENNHFLGCRVEETKAEVHQLKLSESSLMEEVEELKEENHRLQQVFREAANHTPSPSFSIPESSRLSSGASSPDIKPKCTLTYATVMGPSLTRSSGEPSSEEVTISGVHHQAAAESTPRPTEDHSTSPKSKTTDENDSLNHFFCFGSDSNFKSPSFTTESLGEFKLGNWCSKGIFNVEESPSEESDALREAYRSLGLGEDLEKLRQQREHLEAALQRTQEEMQKMSEENAQLKLQLRKLVEEQHAVSEEGSSGEKICRTTRDHRDLLSSSTEDDTTHAVPQEDLTQALNKENRALADRIQELFVHIKLKEEETMTEQTKLKESISRLEDNVVKLEQENQEQTCLNAELTKKTEDDLNTIMELQQKMLESEEQRQESDDKRSECRNALWLSDYNSVISGHFPPSNKDECTDSSAAGVLKREEAQLICNQETEDSASDFRKNSHNDSLRSNSQKTLHVSVLTDEMVQRATSIQRLKTEQQVLSDNINALKEQQQDVTLSVHQQTEEKKQLTRAIWGLKEERDCVSQSLACLKQEKEQLNRMVCGLKDKKDQFERSTGGLKLEKEQLTQSILVLEGDKEAIHESLSRGKAERDQIMQLLQSLQAESDELSQAAINLKEERDKLTNSLLCLKEQRNQEQLSDTLKEKPAELIKSVSTLKEENESAVCFKQNRKQIMLVIQGPREDKCSLQAEDIQTPTETRSETQNLLNAGSTNVTKKPDGHAGNYATQRCQTDHTGSLTQQEESDLTKEIEALGAKLKRSQDELDKTCVETKRLCSELCQSDGRREEAERKAVQAAEKLMGLSDVNSQMEEIRKENDNLTTQVKQLQNRLTNLLREKSDILSLKSQTEEQYNILTAQLKAKTVALEELNSEYIVLKRGQGNRDDLSTALVSLRARYNDIRAKYDALLKRKSQTDLDVAPLKAKLSCLVMKCQERNNLLAQMMKIMHRRGFVDSNLTHQVEMLLRDATLQDYTAAFTPVGIINRPDYWTALKPEFISMFQDYNRDSASLHEQSSVSKQQKNWVTPEAETQRCGGEKHSSAAVTTKSPTNLKVCIHEVAPAGKKITDLPVQEPGGVQVSSPAVPLTEGLMTVQPSHSGRGLEETGGHHMDVTDKSSPDRTSFTGPSLSRASPSSNTRFSPSRRLSSPEKILNLHEQLQKTLMSSYRDEETQGREQESRRSLPLPASETLNASSRTKKQNLSFRVKQTACLPVTTASTQAKHSPAVTATNKSTTLFNAVISRSASTSFSPGRFANLPCKAETSKTTSTLSSSSLVTVAPSKDKPLSSDGLFVKSPKLTNKIAASPDTPDALRPVSADQNQTTASDGKSVKPEKTASNTTKIEVSDTTSEISGTALGFSTSCTRSGSCSPKKSKKSAREKNDADKPKPDAPAAVGFVEVIKTVGQSSLLIGWERPPLDELFCSNGTFVYGYRVVVDGEFHKSVMSSACTKCVLENVDLSLPLHIGVQTLGSNGLASNSVHTVYRTSARTDQR